MGNGAMAIGPQATAPILGSTKPVILLDRPSRLGDHVALREPERRHGRRRLAAEAWPRTL
jgi:hypothetical protein